MHCRVYCGLKRHLVCKSTLYLFRMCEGTNINKAIELYQSAGELREVLKELCKETKNNNKETLDYCPNLI